MSPTCVYRSEEGRRLVLSTYDAILERWPVPFERLTVETSIGETFVLASGPGAAPPLVLLHGAGARKRMGVSASAEAPIRRCPTVPGALP